MPMPGMRMPGGGCAGGAGGRACRVWQVGAWRRKGQGTCVMARGACALGRCRDARASWLGWCVGVCAPGCCLGAWAHAAAACLSGGPESCLTLWLGRTCDSSSVCCRKLLGACDSACSACLVRRCRSLVSGCEWPRGGELVIPGIFSQACNVMPRLAVQECAAPFGTAAGAPAARLALDGYVAGLPRRPCA